MTHLKIIISTKSVFFKISDLGELQPGSSLIPLGCPPALHYMKVAVSRDSKGKEFHKILSTLRWKLNPFPKHNCFSICKKLGWW